jgi:hypothetical protein
MNAATGSPTGEGAVPLEACAGGSTHAKRHINLNSTIQACRRAPYSPPHPLLLTGAHTAVLRLSTQRSRSTLPSAAEPPYT